MDGRLLAGPVPRTHSPHHPLDHRRRRPRADSTCGRESCAGQCSRSIATTIPKVTFPERHKLMVLDCKDLHLNLLLYYRPLKPPVAVELKSWSSTPGPTS